MVSETNRVDRQALGVAMQGEADQQRRLTKPGSGVPEAVGCTYATIKVLAQGSRRSGTIPDVASGEAASGKGEQMFFRREMKTPPPEPPKHVYCYTCGVAVATDRAQRIKKLGTAIGGEGEEFRCQSHRESYDEVLRPSMYLGGLHGLLGATSSYSYFTTTTSNNEPRYFKRVEVSEDGVPLGYVAKKK